MTSRLPILLATLTLAAGAAQAQDEGVEPCVDALAAEAGVDSTQITIEGTEANEGGSDVMLAIDGAPWNCQVDTEGNVIQLTYTGGEEGE